MSSPIDDFGLNFEQTRILYSFQYFLVQEDIEKETEFVKKRLKRRWLHLWRESIEKFLATLDGNNLDESSYSLFTDYSLLEQAVLEVQRAIHKRRALYSITLELVLFTAYAPFGTEEDEEFSKLKLSEQFKPQYIQKLTSFARTIGVESEFTTTVKSKYEEFSNEITGSNSNPFNMLLGALMGGVVVAAVAAAIAIPVIVPLLAPIIAPGLSGAAAISAVLAALGGGAIAAGGFGMAGGMAVIVGGGAIIGAGTGTTISSFFAESPSLAVHEAAKFLVAFKYIILAQKDVDKGEIAQTAQEIIRQQREYINELEKQIDEMQINGDNPEQVNRLQKVIIYLRKALEISTAMVRKFLSNND